MSVQIADTDEKIVRCWDVIHELRTHLVKEEFLHKVKQIQSEGGIMVFIEEDGNAVAAGVFRMNHYLVRGKNIYVDDLSTLPEYRSKGYGTKILDWIKQFAIENNCDNIHLDSGHARYPAHRLYLNYGFRITSHHFVMDLKK